MRKCGRTMIFQTMRSKPAMQKYDDEITSLNAQIETLEKESGLV